MGQYGPLKSYYKSILWTVYFHLEKYGDITEVVSGSFNKHLNRILGK